MTLPQQVALTVMLARPSREGRACWAGGKIRMSTFNALLVRRWTVKVEPGVCRITRLGKRALARHVAIKEIRERVRDIRAVPDPPESADIVDRCYIYGMQLLAGQIERMLRGVPR